jgi:hypothetical protein
LPVAAAHQVTPEAAVVVAVIAQVLERQAVEHQQNLNLA